MRNCEFSSDLKSIYNCETSNGWWRVCMRAREILKVFLESSHACLKFPGWAQWYSKSASCKGTLVHNKAVIQSRVMKAIFWALSTINLGNWKDIDSHCKLHTYGNFQWWEKLHHFKRQQFCVAKRMTEKTVKSY